MTTSSTKKHLLAGTSALALVAAASVIPSQAYAAFSGAGGNTVTGNLVATETAGANGDVLTVTGSGNSVVVAGGLAVDSNGKTGLGVVVNAPTAGTVALSSSGDFSTISVTGAGTSTTAVAGGIVITQGTVTGASTTATNGTIALNGAAATDNINNTVNGVISNTGAGGNVIYIGATAANVFTLTNAGTISATNAAASTGILVADKAGQSAAITNTGTINVGALGTAIKAGAGANSQVNVTQTSGTITGAIDLSGNTNAASTLAVNGGTINGNVLLGAAGQALTLGGGQINGTITGPGAATATASYTTNGNIASLTSLTVNDAITFNAATNNNTIGATAVTVGSAGGGTAVLSLGTGTLTGTIDGDQNGKGTLNFKGTNTTAGAIGGTHNLGTINVTDGTILTTGAGVVKASQINVGTSTAGATWNVGAGAITGLVDSSAAGKGTINFTQNETLGAATNIGSVTGFGSVNITDGKVLTVGTNTIKATNVVVGTAGAGTAQLTLGTGTITGLIDGDAAGKGIINFTNNNTTAGNIGSVHSLATVAITDGKTVDASGANNSISATNVTLGTANGGGATLKLGTGVVTGAIDGDQNGNGVLTFTANQTLAAASAIGSTHNLATVNINDGVTIDDSVNNNVIKATNVTIGSTTGTGSVLTLGTGAVTGAIDAKVAGVGVLNIAGTQTTGGAIGGGTKLAALNITDGKTVTLGGNVTATKINIGTSTAGATLATAGNTLTGAIDSAAAGTGVLNVTGNATLGALSTIGATNGLATVNITDGDTLTATTAGATIKATNIVLGTTTGVGATLALGTGAVTGAIDGKVAGQGVVNFTQANVTNGNIGATTGIASVVVTAGKEVNLSTNNNSIKATNLTLGAASILDLGTGTVTGAIDGAANNNGVVNFSGTQTLAGAVGVSGAHNVAMAEIKSGGNVTLGSVAASTFNANLVQVDTDGTLNFGSSVAHTIKGDVTGTGTGTISTGTKTTTLAAGDNGAGSGNFTTAAGNTVNVSINSGTVNDNGNIVAVNGSVAAGTKVVADLSGATGYIADGKTYQWLSGVGAGTNAATISDNSALLSFTETAAGNLRTLVAHRVAGGYGALATETDTKSVGSVLEALGATTTDVNLKAFQARLEGSSTAAALDSALKEVTPQITATGSQAITTTGQSLNVVGTRLADLRAGIDNSNTGMAAGGRVADKGLWIQGFGTTATQDLRNGVDGYDATTGGFAVGGDMAVTDQLRAGLSFSYSKTTVDSNGSAIQSTDVDSYQVNAYGSYNMNKWYTDGLLGVAFQNFNSDRTIAAPSVIANGDFNGRTYTARTGGGYHFDAMNGFDITPNASLTYYYNDIDSYTETGAGGLDLSVASHSTQALYGRIGADVGYSFTQNDMMIRPVVRAAYMYDFVGDQASTNAFFTGGGATFVTKDASPERNSFNLGASLNIARTDNISFSADYDYLGKSGYDSHSGVLRARFDF